jgi:NitT/TauT family transport system ATP-binding protein
MQFRLSYSLYYIQCDIPMEIACRHLSKSFVTRNGPVTALRDVSFDVRTRSFVTIVGPSGCGKTTLLKIIAGLLIPDSGTIGFGDGGRDRRPALVFQNHGLLPWLTVLDNVSLGLEMRGVKKYERHLRARGFIEQVGLTEFADSFPHQLSVGMQQRTAIARAFVSDPHILLMDEPFSAIDAQTRVVLQEELLRIWREYMKTVVYVTHDIEEAILLSDRVMVMSGRPGRIREEIPIPLERPRDLMGRDTGTLQEIKWHIWNMLEQEIRGTAKSSR